MTRYGAIEAGGTKFVCAVGSGPDHIDEQVRIDTTTPGETMGRVIDFFRQRHLADPLAGIGVGCFGPIDLDRTSATYGHITTTPKPGWAGTDVVGEITKGLGLPVGFDTDVNAAALGEHRWGAARDVDQFIYLTVGTGIGGGAMVAGELVHGLLHPEMGHMGVPRDEDERAGFEGVCPFHGGCLEGMASGPAMAARWGRPAGELSADHEAWRLEARYLARGLWTLTCALSPKRLILGGGVMEQPHLVRLVREALVDAGAGYLQSPALGDGLDDFVVTPGLGTRAGICGALALAERASAS